MTQDHDHHNQDKMLIILLVKSQGPLSYRLTIIFLDSFRHGANCTSLSSINRTFWCFNEIRNSYQQKNNVGFQLSCVLKTKMDLVDPLIQPQSILNLNAIIFAVMCTPSYYYISKSQHKDIRSNKFIIPRALSNRRNLHQYLIPPLPVTSATRFFAVWARY